MSVTLAQIRRILGQRTAQPFFRDFGISFADATGGTSTSLIDTAHILQTNDYWKNQFVYLPATQEQRRIASSVLSSKTITWIGAVTGVPTSGTDYEIWSQFTPQEVHLAINQALRDAWPFFFQTVQTEVVIKVRDGLGYDLSTLTIPPRLINTISLETGMSSVVGQVTSVTTNVRLADSNRTFTAADVGKKLRIYDGTSAGDERTISAIVNATTVTVSLAWTSTLDTTSKYRMVDTTESSRSFTRQTSWSTDALTNPTRLYVGGGHLYGYEGHMIRMRYTAEYQALSAETDSTTIPQEYLELAALARIYAIKISNGPASELKNWSQMYEAISQMAAQYAAKNRFQHLPTTFTDDQQAIGGRDPEYPF